jgi:catechol 2,3-dioxygenase-like lactoylglutathione lyase family enzyme
MTMPRVTSVMIDCRDSQAMAAFWTALLGVEIRNTHENFIWLEPQREGGWSIAFQEVPDPTPGKNKIHLDGYYPDLDGLEERVAALGGRVVDRQLIDGFEWRVYADVEDNVFCFGHPT